MLLLDLAGTLAPGLRSGMRGRPLLLLLGTKAASVLSSHTLHHVSAALQLQTRRCTSRLVEVFRQPASLHFDAQFVSTSLDLSIVNQRRSLQTGGWQEPPRKRPRGGVQGWWFTEYHKHKNAGTFSSEQTCQL